ncbi:hypothetical protein ACFL12_01990 [Pseudomonadota bacterium]
MFQSSRIAVKLIKALIVFSSFITLITTSNQLWMEHGRDLDVESVEGQGTTFTVRLPIGDVGNGHILTCNR